MIGLFFGGKAFKAKFGNDYGNIELDANLEETHEWAADATTNPVEQGVPITDHVIEQPDKFRIRGFISDSPVTASPAILGIVGKTDSSSRTQEIFDLLRQLIKAREVMTVYSKHYTYTDMVMTNVTVPRTPADGQAIEFTADFLHIRTVETQTVVVPKGISAKRSAKAGGSKGSASKKAAPTKDAGKVQAKPAASAPTSIARGLL
jgi:hypothetical protein